MTLKGKKSNSGRPRIVMYAFGFVFRGAEISSTGTTQGCGEPVGVVHRPANVSKSVKFLVRVDGWVIKTKNSCRLVSYDENIERHGWMCLGFQRLVVCCFFIIAPCIACLVVQTAP